jgi:hypothetical protein
MRPAFLAALLLSFHLISGVVLLLLLLLLL